MLTEGNFDFLPSSNGSKMFMVAWMYWYMITFYHLLTTYLNNIAVVKAAVVRMADKKGPMGGKLTTGNSSNSSQQFESDESEVEMEQGRQSEKRSSVDLSTSVESPVRQSIGIVGGKAQPQSQSNWSEAGL